MYDKTKKCISGGRNRTQKRFHTFIPTSTEKSNICKILNPITDDKLVKDYIDLRKMACKGVIKVSAYSRLGNSIVDRFTFKERLHTKGNKDIDFYTFWKNRNYYRTVPYIKNMLQFYDTRNIEEIRKFKYIFNLYFSSISIFRPIVAMELYCKIGARRVLDFTMGWGGRLVGAHALRLESYIGIDTNTNLKQPYKNMLTFLREQEGNTDTPMDIQLYFQDAVQFDYSSIQYDTVFTSPPYYDLEVYRKKKYGKESFQDKEEWHQKFYFPLFTETYKYLQYGGHFCLNVPEEIYQNACIPILGKCKIKMPLKKKQRSDKNQYKEFIYIWQKK
jgi:hypothetical protein